jgi:hypothetical protein
MAATQQEIEAQEKREAADGSQPTLSGVIEGRIVHYVLTEGDAEEINRRRTTRGAIADRIAGDKWPIGAQAHIGNRAEAGQHCAAIIVRFWGDPNSGTSNLQVLLDGNDTYWATSRHAGDPTEQGAWHFPERA